MSGRMVRARFLGRVNSDANVVGSLALLLSCSQDIDRYTPTGRVAAALRNVSAWNVAVCSGRYMMLLAAVNSSTAAAWLGTAR
jgi:hypothetical protein